MSLTYDAARERLYGYVGDEHFAMKAVSGGGRGSTAGMAQYTLTSYQSNTEKNAKTHQRGGTLPGGVYACEYLANHVEFHECIHLRLVTPEDQLMLTKMGGHRGLKSFYIHGRGVLGSDGCIVPMDGPVIRHRLNQAIKKEGGAELTVINTQYGLPASRTVDVSARGIA